MAGPHHRDPDYKKAARLIRDAAYRDPGTRCWRCRRTLAEVHTERPNAVWHAGHLVEGDNTGGLAAECSPCNLAASQRSTMMKREANRIDSLGLTRATNSLGL